jgi:hypothetical protein
VVRQVLVLLCGVLVWSVAPAWAQAAPAPAASPQASGPRVGARLFGHAEWQNMTATRSLGAVTGTTRLQGFGGGAEVQRLWRGVFARLSMTRMTQAGERVFVFENEAYSLGIPLEISLTPIELAVGWRMAPQTSLRIVPYAGAGLISLKYKETSSSDSSSEAISESYGGVLIFGGAEVPVWRMVSLGAEVGWRKVKVPQPAGALRAFNENDLGGVTMRVMLSVSR